MSVQLSKTLATAKRKRIESITFRLVRSNGTYGKHGLTSTLLVHQPSQLVARGLVLVVPDRIYMRITRIF